MEILVSAGIWRQIAIPNIQTTLGQSSTIFGGIARARSHIFQVAVNRITPNVSTIQNLKLD